MDRYEAVLFDLFGTLVDGRGEAVPGARDLLDALPSARIAIVTSTSRRMAEGLLAHAKLPEPLVLVTADDVAHGKPAPDCYMLAARRLGVEPARCLVVEDSEHGVDAGAAAGMDVVAIMRGRGTDFAKRATQLVDRLSDLKLRSAPEGIAVG
ncbi:MAG: HAD family hydrolase [Vulcanimicrobiaceae bacterium]